MLKKKNKLASFSGVQLPVVVERDEDGMYVVECTVLNGCYSQGRTIDEALQNIREAISLALEDGMGYGGKNFNVKFPMFNAQ